MNINIPNNIAYVLKYLAVPAFLFILFLFGGFKGIPYPLTALVILLLGATEVWLVPYDLGKTTKDDVHFIPYNVTPIPTATRTIKKYSIRYYSKSGLQLVKFLYILCIVLFGSSILPLMFWIFGSL